MLPEVDNGATGIGNCYEAGIVGTWSSMSMVVLQTPEMVAALRQGRGNNTVLCGKPSSQVPAVAQAAQTHEQL
jgi:hypothetical protein